MIETSITKCRVCGNSELIPCLDLGKQYLSSIFPDNLNYREKLSRYSLDLVLCKKDDTDAHCGLLQLGHDFDMKKMYKDYPYTSSSNSSMQKILYDVAQSGLDRINLETEDAILDIGCNDGTLLSFFNVPELENLGIQLLGIDAAENVRPEINYPNFRFQQGFFSEENFYRIAWKKARLIFSVAMFYHLSDPVTFCREVEKCMVDDGIWVIQMAYLPTMLETNMYDNIVHEHCGYYGIETLQWIMNKAGLEIFDAEVNDVYGGSFRVFVRKQSCKKYEKTLDFINLLGKEYSYDIYDPKTYLNFNIRIDSSREDLCRLLRKLNLEGKTIWAYGASTKGNTILQYCDIGQEDIYAVADCNSFKQNKYLIGSDVPILSEDLMRIMVPDYLLVLPYSFTQNFMEREKDLVHKGTKFIRPLPYVKILEGNTWA